MRDLWRTATKDFSVPAFEKAEAIFRSFSASGRILFLFFAWMLVVSTVGLLYLLNDHTLVAIPAHGGSFAEGIVGAPRFINPVLAISDADRDLAILTYSGLLRATAEGSYTTDLAELYEVSPDGKTYTVTLRENARFHDGRLVTADDVVFTIAKTQDPVIKSPARANWDGVGVEVLDARTIRFTLKAPYAPFIKNLTFGILPKYLWEKISSEEFPFSNLNTSPIGSGPFKIGRITRTPSGIPSSYELRAFGDYAQGAPYLTGLTIRFYQNEDELVAALKRGEIDAASDLSPAILSKLESFPIKHAPLNRVFGVFFNQNQSLILRDKDVRKALADSIDKEALITEVLGGYGTPLEGPVPPTVLHLPLFPQTRKATTSDPALYAREQLLKKGWKEGENGILKKTSGSGKNAQTTILSFSLSTGNILELRAAAEYLRTTWSKVGAQVDIKIFDQGDLSQNVIRPRKYDALLFGEVVGRELDLFAFWHSSQRNDPGLNIALYANSNADTLLEQLRETGQVGQRMQLYEQFNAELEKDIPALFLYTPDFVYVFPDRIKGFEPGFIETPSERFLSAASWHREVEYVWPIFAHARDLENL